MASTLRAMDYIWLIGGGPVPNASQVSIEENVSWISELLPSEPGRRVVFIYFSDGNDSGRDVSFKNENIDEFIKYEPIARVFNHYEDNKIKYRTHNIKNVTGPTTKNKLSKSLRKDFSLLTPNDRAIIIYNGHGLFNEKSEGNTIRLWEDTELSVQEFEELISIIPREIPVHFVFPQCFSGGFWRLINEAGVNEPKFADAVRCGFFAESERRESEG